MATVGVKGLMVLYSCSWTCDCSFSLVLYRRWLRPCVCSELSGGCWLGGGDCTTVCAHPSNQRCSSDIRCCDWCTRCRADGSGFVSQLCRAQFVPVVLEFAVEFISLFVVRAASPLRDVHPSSESSWWTALCCLSSSAWLFTLQHSRFNSVFH